MVFALRPFQTKQPYAEVGPAFLCADEFAPHGEIDGVPEIFHHKAMLIRGYDSNERILYGTGKVVPADSFEQECAQLLEMPDVPFVHVRSSTNNCFQARIEPAL